MTTEAGASLTRPPVHYDPGNDLALLRIDAPLPALEIASEQRRGDRRRRPRLSGKRPLRVDPGPLGDTRNVLSEDSYGRGPIRRRIAFLRGSVRSGNSGGPMVDSARQGPGDRLRRDHLGPGRGSPSPTKSSKLALGDDAVDRSTPGLAPS